MIPDYKTDIFFEIQGKKNRFPQQSLCERHSLAYRIWWPYTKNHDKFSFHKILLSPALNFARFQPPGMKFACQTCKAHLFGKFKQIFQLFSGSGLMKWDFSKDRLFTSENCRTPFPGILKLTSCLVLCILVYYIIHSAVCRKNHLHCAKKSLEELQFAH